MSDNTEPHIPFPASGSYPARAGNRVRPLIDGEPAFRRICEAVEAARHSVWITIAFLRSGFLMPGGRGSLFDLLDDAVARGLDIRVIFWRADPATRWAEPELTFWGSEGQRRMLQERRSRFRVRWDRAPGPCCQHQKSWLVDAGQPSETAFVGGINLNPRSMVSPGHAGDGQHHDLYVEVTGPAATDVHHNFVQRWNEASDRRTQDGHWGHDGDDDLAFPAGHSRAQGDSLVQIQRTVHAGCYSDGRATPGGRPYAIAAGERSIFDQYLTAIDCARRSIYIENQAITVPAVLARLQDALDRGVEVILLVPTVPEDGRSENSRSDEPIGLSDGLASLGRHERLALVGIAGPGAGRRHSVHVHAKAMLIDDAWATIGSCNLHASSLFGNTEMNVSFWDPGVVRALRCELFTEHLGRDTVHLDDRAALALYRDVATENRRRRDSGDNDWMGLAFSLVTAP